MKYKCPNMQNMQKYAIYANYALKPQNMQKLHILCKCIFCPSLVIIVSTSDKCREKAGKTLPTILFRVSKTYNCI
jgi:hypothetical protein